MQETSEQRAKPRANLRRRPLAPSRPARADRDGRGHQLHQRDARANGIALVKSGDGGVGAVSLGLRRQAEHNDARYESPKVVMMGRSQGRGAAQSDITPIIPSPAGSGGK